ncbi:phage tail tape measure protein [Bacillus sp. ISL-51]|uniref:phage tail tape measure protein n=1 Tax=Bacteria TaxID=2 RepID=UPI001BE7B04B|nr:MULTISPECIES: phage tail tape measure protein [Bacteria]MBT2574871.1 phage tail tape measure protein [Bacillus sp. ISL-51]MBT2714172.1 phage tail tape measure protein [Pseudomonas sp. ISL-88]
MADQSILVRIGADISNLTHGLTESARTLSDFGSRMTNMGTTVAAGFGVVSAGVIGGLTGMAKSSADFDTAMRKAGAIAGASESQFKDMKDAALELGATTSKSASEVAGAMTELAAKGMDANQVIEAMPGIIKAAEASGEDLALTSDTVTSALNAFQMEAGDASKVADILTVTANKSAAGMNDMSYALKYAAGPAHQLGISLEELSAAAGIMVDAGADGSQAGTTLRASLLRLVDPPKAAATMLERLGVTTTDSKGKFKSLQEIVGDLKKSMEGMTKAEKGAALARIFGTESVSGMMAVIAAGPDKLGKFTKELERSGGAAEKAGKKMKAGIGGALENLSGAFETMFIKIGDELAPFIQSTADRITDLINWFNELSAGAKRFVAVSLAVVGGLAGIIALTGAAVAIIGSLISATGTIVTAFSALATSMGMTSGALMLLLGGYALIAGAVIAAVAAIVILIKHSEAIRNKFAALADTIGSKLAPAISTLKTLFSGLATILTGDFASGADKLRQILPESVVQLIIAAATSVQNAITNLIDAVNKAFQGDFSSIAKYIPTIVGMLVGGLPGLIIAGMRFLPAIEKGIQTYLPTFLNGFVNLVDTVVNQISTNLPKLAQAGVQIITGLLNGLNQALPNILSAITQALSTLIQGLTTLIPTLVGAGVLIITSLVQGIVTALPVVITAVTQLLTMLINTLISLLPMIINAGIQILNALIQGIIAMLPGLINAAIQLIMALINALVTNLPLIVEAGIQVLTALIDGIITMLPQLIEMALYLIVSLVQALIDNLPQIIDAGIQLITALIEGLIQMLPQLVAAAIQLITQLVNTIIRFMPQLIELGIKLLDALVRGLIQAIPKILEMGVKIVTDLASAIGDNVSKVFDAGVDLIKGLWNGINSAKDWILGKIGDFAGSITDSIKGFFGIHSPSRVFRDEVGKFLPLGLAVGIERNIGAVQSAATAMANAAMIDAQDYAYNPSMSLTGGKLAKVKHAFETSVTQPDAGQPMHIELVTVMDGEEIGRRTERVVSAEQGRKISIKNLMQG